MRTIVVGIDESEHAEQALRWAVEHAEFLDARVVAVHAWTPALLAIGAAGWNGSVPEPATYAEQQREAAAAVTEGALALVAPFFVDIAVRTVMGPAADVLLQVAADEGAELIVVGNGGHGALASLVLGSVPTRLEQHARCPVVVVPARDAA